MKKFLFTLLFFALIIIVEAQTNKPDYQNVTTTATLKSASRLFGAKDDLTTVILIIPSGSTVTVLESDSTYFHVTFEENEGYIFKRHAVIDRKPVAATQTIKPKQQIQGTQPVQPEQMSRFSYLESKYGANIAARLNSGKIWKGMNAEMVKDSWGTAEKVTREISGNIIKEEWIFKNTWLYLENNTLVDWGPVRN